MAISIPNNVVTNPWSPFYVNLQLVIDANGATFSGLSDAAVASQLNAMTSVPITNIATSDIREYLFGTGELGNIISLAENVNSSSLGPFNMAGMAGVLGTQPTQATMNSACMLLEIMRYQRTFHSNLASVMAGYVSALNQLVTGKAIAQSTATYLTNLNVPAIAMWQPIIQTLDITQARALG